MNIKTEHNGAKRGNGYWGTKAEAKSASKKRRREKAKQLCRKAHEKSEPPPCKSDYLII